MPPDEKRDMRGQRVAYLAQSAAATFNPALTIGEQVTESPVLHGQMSREEAGERAEELYRALELPDPDRLGRRYPHQVSGGQLQRLMAAMALCGKPDLLILDEPTTALDVTTQIEVLKAFKSVIKREGAAALYVTHDLSVVAQIADRIVVLYAGDILEQGDADQVINRPSHDYTRRLMAAVRPPPAAGQGDAALAEHVRESPALEVRGVNAGYGRRMDGTVAVKAVSRASASGLVRKVDIDPMKYPVIEWRWKVDNILEKGDVTRKEGDDYPARLYITFRYDPDKAGFFVRARYEAIRLARGEYPPMGALTYIWENRSPVGTVVPNPYTDRVMMIVLRSGADKVGQWVSESRNLVDDYRKAFGADPPRISGVAVMTDTDNTGGVAVAYYGDVTFTSE
jgi:ABC-type dipeptide/oligopeptide/nickel transport system ATPase subunit